MSQPSLLPSDRRPRRTVLRAGAWSVPAVAAAVAAPASAASQPDEVTIKSGLFAQVHDTRATGMGRTRYGISSFREAEIGTDGAREGVDDAGVVLAGSTLASAGGGTFTPGGSLGAGREDRYGGVGLWISVPMDASGNFLSGSATLPAGAGFHLDFTAEFPAGKKAYMPVNWKPGKTANRVALTSGGTSKRPHLNGAAFRGTYSAGAVDGNIWTGSLDIVLTESLVANDPQRPYAQILFSQIPVYYEYRGPTVFRVEVTSEQAPVLVSAAGHPQKLVFLSGDTVSASLSH